MNSPPRKYPKSLLRYRSTNSTHNATRFQYRIAGDMTTVSESGAAYTYDDVGSQARQVAAGRHERWVEAGTADGHSTGG